MTDEELSETERYLNALIKNQKELVRVLKELYADIPEVKEFYETIQSLKSLKSKINTLTPKVNIERQKRCSHPIWYLLFKPNNINEQSKISCQCIKCGKKETRLLCEFPGDFIIEKDITYDSIKHIYDEFMKDISTEEKNNENETAKKFVKKIKEEYEEY